MSRIWDRIQDLAHLNTPHNLEISRHMTERNHTALAQIHDGYLSREMLCVYIK